MDLGASNRMLYAGLVVTVAGVVFAAPQQGQVADPVAAASQSQALVKKYCVSCHSEKLKTAGLSLESLDTSKVTANADVWEKVIRKVHTGSMPPQGMPRPDQPAMDGFTSYLETTLDRAAMVKPNPGRATLHRLNRTEYTNAIKEVLGLDIDGAALLPNDDESYGFDNIADVLKTSPALIERYMSASWNISRLAVGNQNIVADTTIYRVRPDLSQDDHIEGLPLGTRGGIKFTHNFQLDGEYIFRVRMWRATTDIFRGLKYRNEVEYAIDGKRVGLVRIGGREDEKESEENSGLSASNLDQRLTLRIPVKAGPHEVVITFLKKTAAQEDDILQPFLRSNVDPVGYQGQLSIDRVSVNGPLNPTGISETPSRKKIFICRPGLSNNGPGLDEVSCAKKILGTLARKSYRRPITEKDTEQLLTFFQKGKNEGKTFDAGIEAGIQLILASPEFLFRFEPDPPNVALDVPYKVNDLELASRLSFFLWSTIPDEQLINLATQGKLKDPAVLEQQVKRMVADPKGRALTENFAGQWLFLRNLKSMNPDFETFPDFDDNLRQAMRRETELFFASILTQDSSIMDLMNGDYTFVNERLAKHYGMKGIYGEDFRRVPVTDENRRGILGQASILAVTSVPTRTSPVQRGKWILSNLLGTPPPAPPPNVPALKTSAESGKPSSLRERMEAHRANPYCAACHKVMDPLGFSLENFDAVGQWRDMDEGAKIDPSGTLFEGTKVAKPADLRKALTARPEVFAGVFTEKLMTYALGRGVEYSDMPTIRAILRDAKQSNYKFSSILMGVIKSAPFQMKVKKAPESNVAENRPSVKGMVPVTVAAR
jgi:mono/diheme cytochrome c family protein